MKYLISLLILFSLVLVQRSLLPLLLPALGLPHLVLLFVLIHHFMHPSRTVVVEALVAGIFLDLTGMELVGITSITLIAILLLTNLLDSRLRFSFWQMLLVVSLSSLALRLVVTFPHLVWQMLLSGVLLDIILFVLFFPLLFRMYRVVLGRPVREMSL